MKVNPVNFFKNKKALAGMLCVGLLVTASFFIQNLSNRIRQITVLGEGVQTCYQRIHQSYTARVLGDLSAPYLEQSFLTSTGDCLADTMSFYEANLDGFLTGGVTLLNEVNSLTDEFHNKLGGLEGNPENIVASVLGRRFEKLETKKDEFLEKLEAVSGKAMASYSSLKWSFFLLIGLVSFFFLGELWNSWNLSQANNELEEQAEDMLQDPGVSAQNVEALITSALELNGLPKTALLVNGSVRVESESLPAEELRNDIAGKPVPVLSQNKEAINAQIDEIWNQPAQPGLPKGAPQVATNEPESVSLDDILSNTLELLSSRFVTSAITVDMNISEELKVYGGEEEIQQVIYLLLNQNIRSCEGLDSGVAGHLSLNAKILGNSTFLSLFDSGNGFSKEFLDFNRGLTSVCPEEYKDLLIVKEFAKSLKADLTFENLLGSDGKVAGGKTQIAFRAPGVSLPKKRLISLRKGKKRDLEASFS
ncbi:MAG: hypothetical protein ACJAT2_000923 [Bacteriovoracaceae bacterium]|jgi:hypothetical protein